MIKCDSLNYLEALGDSPSLCKEKDSNVSDITRLINMQSKPITKTSEQTMNQKTSEKSKQMTFQTTKSSVVASPANRSLSQEKEWALKIHEELSFLKSQGLLKSSDHTSFSLRMLKDYYHTIEGGHLPLSLPHLMNWGIMQNGKCLTANILESPKIGKGCLLSGILEAEVPERYFLSPQMEKRIMGYKRLHRDILPQTQMEIISVTQRNGGKLK